jgi:hypothetical protein
MCIVLKNITLVSFPKMKSEAYALPGIAGAGVGANMRVQF